LPHLFLPVVEVFFLFTASISCRLPAGSTLWTQNSKQSANTEQQLHHHEFEVTTTTTKAEQSASLGEDRQRVSDKKNNK
jgi:hypothetical protein